VRLAMAGTASARCRLAHNQIHLADC
jgi:hypothetical protein